MANESNTNPRKEFIRKLAYENQKFYGSPRGRGILNAIRRSFDHHRIYIFELLQNALDAGAEAISIRIGSDSDSLIIQHDGGRELSEKDVEHLSQIMLSDKGESSIGFMGIGFKSVFLRFREARISGWNWNFRFDVRSDQLKRVDNDRPNLLGAVVPIWDAKVQNPSQNFTTRFELRGRANRSEGLDEDLEQLFLPDDKSLLAILASFGLRRIELNGRVWDLSVASGTCSTSVAIAASGGKTTSWQLFETEFCPSDKAAKCFLEQRGSTMPYDEGGATTRRKVLGILPLDQDGVPVSSWRGRVFATLPTDVYLPFGLHINADWLLNISRTGLRDIETNAWQREIVDCIADVLARFVIWSAKTYFDPVAAKASFGVLAAPDSSASGLEGRLAEKRWLNIFAELLKNSAVLPVWAEEQVSLAYAVPRNAVRPPFSLAKAFEEMQDTCPGILLGRKVINCNILGGGARELFDQANLIFELTPSELERAWPSAITRWWKIHAKTEERRQRMLLRIWAAVAELSQEKKWDDIELNCVLTAAGSWRSINKVTLFTDELPTDKEPGGKETREFFTPYLKAAEQIPRSLTRALREVARREGPGNFVYKKAQSWMQINAQPVSLKDVAERALRCLASSENPDWSVLVPFGRWARHRNRSDLLMYVLTDSHNGSAGVPVRDAVVADPYVCDGAGRRAIYCENSPVSKKYLDVESKGNDIESWRDFFYQAGVKGKLEIRHNQSTARRSDKKRVAEFLGINENTIGKSNVRGYELLDYDIVPSLPVQSLPFEVRVGIASWLDEGRSKLICNGRRSAKYFYFEQQTCTGKIVCEWVSKLKSVNWVPCNDGELRKPEEVLFPKDPDRPSFPYAKLSHELVSVLEGEGVSFGTAVPEDVALHKLKEWGGSSAEKLTKLLDECKSQIKSEADHAQCIQILESKFLSLHDGRRVRLNRVVKSRSRDLLDGWVVQLSDLDPKLRDALDRVKYPFPVQTTGEQAFGYIRNAWIKASARSEKLTTEEYRALPYAYEYCLDDCENDEELRVAWKEALPEAAVIVDGEWIVVAEVDEIYVNDLVDRRHAPKNILSHAVSREHLGVSNPGQYRTAAELGLRSLKDSVELIWGEGEAMPLPELWPLRFDLICELLKCVIKLNGQPEVGDTGVEHDSRLSLVLVRELTLQIKRSGPETENVPVDAHLRADKLVVTGEPPRFASDSAKELMHRYSFAHRGDLVIDLTGLLYTIDDDVDFRRAVEKFRLSYAPDFEIPSSYERCFVEGSKMDPENSWAESEPSNGLVVAQEQDIRLRNDLTTENDTLGSRLASPGVRSGAGGASYTDKRAEAQQRTLLRKLRKAVKGEILPNTDSVHTAGRTNGEPCEELGDERFREAVEQYEKERGWNPVLCDPHQIGWDIRSSDPNTGEVRLIEVKGKGTRWTGSEVVELSHAQVRKAFEALSPENGMNWYLYVVEPAENEGWKVLPIENPAKLARSWMLRGEAWRHLASD